jgi:hypothetical protein
MFYEVLVLSDGGERFTIERDAPLAAGDSFPNESEFYRVLAIEPGHGPFAGSSKPSGLSSWGVAAGREVAASGRPPSACRTAGRCGVLAGVSPRAARRTGAGSGAASCSTT